jgi:hypothetical protein
VRCRCAARPSRRPNQSDLHRRHKLPAKYPPNLDQAGHKKERHFTPCSRFPHDLAATCEIKKATLPLIFRRENHIEILLFRKLLGSDDSRRNCQPLIPRRISHPYSTSNTDNCSPKMCEKEILMEYAQYSIEEIRV